MRMIAFAGLCSVVMAAVLGQVVAVPPTGEEIARAIEELGSSQFEVRQGATELLWRAGAAAETPLQQAAKSNDPEIRARANALLNKLRLGLRPDTPADVVATIDQFRYSSTTA